MDQGRAWLVTAGPFFKKKTVDRAMTWSFHCERKTYAVNLKTMLAFWWIC